ncbi:MAG: YHS domain-containing protein [Actinobacteria bacterium]|nr:YHS domain-containing protein [Actinomycetota bacterium]
MAADSVYKMQVEESTARWASEYEGETYCFCAPGCRHVFDESPEQYVSG